MEFAVTATDSNPGPLTFQFSSAYGTGAMSVIRNFNIGTSSAGVWTAQPFSWASIRGEGGYTIQVVAKDFATGETATQTVPFTLTTALSGGAFTVLPTVHPLVALAAVPPCAVGSAARVVFTRIGASHSSTTNYQPCAGNVSSNFYVGGLQVSGKYNLTYQVRTGTTVVNGPGSATFKAGALPNNISIPAQTVVLPPQSQSYTPDKVLLHGYLNTAAPGKNYQPTATDLLGNVIWFYNSTDLQVLLTRPLEGGNFLALQSGTSWDANAVLPAQVWRRFDLTGNIVKETNIGVLQQQFLALGATNLRSCASIPRPVAVGSSCLGSVSHDVILMPNGDYAFIGIMEKVFPPGTQGDTTGLNVDILGEAVMVVDSNLNALWYFDTFQHDSGGMQLDINRPAVLHEVCNASGAGGCPPLFLAGTPGVTTNVNDWLHCNSLQYRASDGNFVLSSRSQDWVMLIDYNNGAGTGNILWRMGPSGDFTFNNINNDTYPWFSHQHDAAFEPNGIFDTFDNGNTRVSMQGGNSRGMALMVDESAFTVTPVLSQDLGYYAFALGSAQLLLNGNYHFQPGFVQVPPNNFNYSIELLPTAGTTGATQILNLEGGSTSYRSFRMPDMYTPPST